MRLLVLAIDAFGGRGGMAQHMRDTLEALAGIPEVDELVVVPKLIRDPVGCIPRKVQYIEGASRNSLSFILSALRAVLRGRYDAIICGHVSLLPIAMLFGKLLGVKVILMVYGIEVWTPPRWPMGRAVLRAATHVVSISEYTAGRLSEWSGIPSAAMSVVPCVIRPERFADKTGAGSAQSKFDRDGPMMLTLGRLSSRERYKGFDQLLDVMPRLRDAIPSLTYVIAGDGDDRSRLEQKAAILGVSESVVFTGYISDEEKVRLYRAAEVFAMPGSGEGFGIVYLEAVASGTQVIGSTLDGSAEALRGGLLGQLVDPSDENQIIEAVLSAIRNPRPVAFQELSYFSMTNLTRRWKQVIERTSSDRSNR